MAEIMGPATEEQPGERLTWSKVWISAITRPSTETFDWILRDPQASPRRAYLWVFITVLISGIMGVLYSTLGFDAGLGEFGSPFIYLICAPVIAAVSVLGIAFNAWVIQWIAGRYFGGSGTYASMIYAMAAYTAPITILGGLIGGIPFVNCLVIPLSIYVVVLALIAVKAVNRIGWGPAVVSYLALPVLLIGITCVLTICALIIFGPSISNVFENIIQQSGGAVP